MIVPATMTFSQRLQVVLKQGNLRVADLARWFNRPHPTVNGWVTRNLNPGGGPADVENAYEMLIKLENYLKTSKMHMRLRARTLPVPTGLSPAHRIKYIKRLRAQALASKTFGGRKAP